MKPHPTLRLHCLRSSTRTTTVTSTRASPQSPQGGGRGEEDGEGVTSAIDTSLLLSDDLSYLGKLTAGSIGGASAIKYGSVLFPGITRPNIVQALLMISLPVLVAVLLLVKESSKKSEYDDFL
ncbi:hypothetical protein Cni_G00308 [Canna indica]|uniref:Uncharacterized protein n=1 Tax=Canna indica TaxID=4628 RepID=A0AAQ3JL28_9LILI|nr:hypothetical protein Cni_G00308 [Canna indica]